jgi:D-cysteine desulfhydrase
MASENLPILFKVYPDLQEKINWLPLGSYPTPVHVLEGFQHPNLWIKRDDLTASAYGGNKIRKLEFIFGDAQRRKKSHIITMGGLGTHHGLATALYCHRLGLSCSLLLYDEPITKAVKQNLLLFHRYGARITYAKSILKAGVLFYTTERLKHPAAYFLYAGGSTPVGTLGYVNAVFELKAQIENGLIPEPDYVFCPLGTNGTLSGLSLGVLLAGLKSTVIGVRVARSHLGPMQLATAEMTKSLMLKTYRLLKSNSASIPVPTYSGQIRAPTVLDQYFGEGYGYPTREGLNALYMMQEKANLKLDSTYTSKTFAAVLDFVKNSASCEDVVLYWHTYSAVDLSDEAAMVDYGDLPAALHQFFEQKDEQNRPH